MKRPRLLPFVVGLASALLLAPLVAAPQASPGAHKIKDVVIYEDPVFYASFPSVVRRPDGELIVAFRRAPNRLTFGEEKNSHVDPNSYLVQVRSRDGGATWTKDPTLIYAHPWGGSQDPCLLQLRDGTLLCASYGWAFVKKEIVPQFKQPVFEVVPGVIFLGGYLVRSTDGGRAWSAPIYPPHVPAEANLDHYGRPIPAYNRGALYEGESGRIFWVVAANTTGAKRRTSNHLLVSDDKGATWRYSATVADDPKVTFNETSVYETPKGDLVAFMRTAGFDDHACLARSTDGGKTFLPWQDMGWRGHPLQATRLPDQRVLLVYGYRHKPYGVRARILNAECTDFATAPEIVLRDDGGSTDVGYPWAVVLEGRRVLVTYYLNLANGTRHIAGTILETN